MGERSTIAWTDATWNPWIGCHKVSPGCAHCYMYRLEERYGRDPSTVRRTGQAIWRAPRKWKPSMVFTCSMSDFFIEEADDWRDEAWEVIRQTPQHTYQILTKRPERIREHLPADWGQGWPNVWLGTSVENQRMADLRIPLLVQMPAVVRFLSCEPLLKAINVVQWLGEDQNAFDEFSRFFKMGRVTAAPHLIHWVICGGESGARARPMNLAWVRSLLRQCQVAGVPFFYKQEGGKPYPNEKDALLDGRMWREMPARVTP